MNKDVILSMRGMHFHGEEDADNVEVITPANYYKKGDSHYLLYEEMDEDTRKVTKNRIKFRAHSLELSKSGYYNAQLIFEEGKKYMTSYPTPFGNLYLGVDTHKVTVVEKEHKIVVFVEYAMDANCEFISECKLRLEIKEKGQGACNSGG